MYFVLHYFNYLHNSEDKFIVMNFALGIVMVCAVLSATSSPPSERSCKSSFVKCLTDDECSSTQCCVISEGFDGQYTLCREKRRLNEACRPPSDYSVNMTIMTPDGQLAPVYGHEYLCPCAEKLPCGEQSHRCGDPIRK